MRTLFLALLALSVTGCTSWSMNYHLNNAYRAYKSGDCQRVQLELSETERKARARPWIQPEISMLRGQCLEREKFYLDAAQTYQFIIARYPTSEYAYRAKARLETLRLNGRLPADSRSYPVTP
ncbi:hypothetical protein N7414_08930 [Pseudomonas sp. GD04087]|uniref:hypothetical protein n=1 Tax=Pseudomonas TaxID=286 RepID=UPI001F33EDEE|nr:MULTISPECIES: hypothetical protein [Pseudomonas]MDH0289236.1 hypothetical protein [Pseudomonas sp. GD04087]MDH1047913.1 hypothetical protein [Pseudomonas sp. GD03903]MDH1998596.1 hypothetical protein [Pseudomonas sp. GD03691]